jgi:hypothetical protein
MALRSWCGFRGARPARLRGVGREARETRGSGGICLDRRSILNADQGQGVAAQDLSGLGELRFASELRRLFQVEHDRRVEEETRAAPHLLGEFGFETGIAQHSGTHHHDGEDCALHEIARHPKYATRPRRCETLRVNPKSCPPQPVLPRLRHPSAPAGVQREIVPETDQLIPVSALRRFRTPRPIPASAAAASSSPSTIVRIPDEGRISATAISTRAPPMIASACHSSILVSTSGTHPAASGLIRG